MAITHSLPVKLTADEMQTLEALAVLTGLTKEQYLSDLVSAGLLHHDLLLRSLDGASQAQLRQALGVKQVATATE